MMCCFYFSIFVSSWSERNIFRYEFMTLGFGDIKENIPSSFFLLIQIFKYDSLTKATLDFYFPASFQSTLFSLI